MNMMLLWAQTDDALASSLNGLGAAPYWVLACYLLLLLGLGIAGWLKSHRDEEDYYLAGRRQGWIVSSLTIMATFFSSFAMLGAPGMVYREGVVFALFSLNVPVAGLCVYLFGARIWKLGQRFGYVTPGDMVADYYGSRVSLRLLVALTGFLYAIPYVVMQIQAGGLVSQQLFGPGSFEVGAIVLAAITMLYIMIGGMRSVAWTDLVQGILLIVGMLVAGMAMILVFGGLGEFSQAITHDLPDSSLTAPGNTGTWAWPMVLSLCLLASSGSMVQPAQWMRYFSANSVTTLRRGAVIFSLVLTSCFLFGVMLIGLAGQALYPLQFSYSVNLPSHTAEKATAAVNAASGNGANLPTAFSVQTNDTDDDAQLRWSWQGRDKQLFTETDLAVLQSLNADPDFQNAVQELQTQVQHSQQRPAVAPNRLVDTNGKADYDAILVVVLTKQFPRVLGQFGAIFASLLIVAIMAAAMSTADSNLHALSAVLTRDVYDQFVRPNASEVERVWLGRGVIVAATLLALGIVMVGRRPELLGKYDLLSMIAKMGLMAIAFSAQLLPITIDMLFLRKGASRGAAVGLAAGLLVVFLFGPLFQMFVDTLGRPAPLAVVLDGINALKFTPLHGSVWGLAVNIPLFVIISMLSKSKPPPGRERFAEVLR